MADMVEGVRESQVIRLIAALESDDEVVEPILRRVRSEIPSYQAVGREQIVASVHRILRRVCRTLRAGEVPPPDEFWEAERATVERLGAGVPIEDIMAGFRVTIASIQGRLVELAVECGVDGADVVALTSLLWRLSDAFSARAAADYHRQGLALAMADQRRRDEWLAGALAGDLDHAQLERGYTVYRLRRDTTYRAFCTGPGEEQRIEQVQRALAEHHGHGVLMAPTRDRLVGIMENLPTPVPGQLIALGVPAPVDRLATSYRSAQDVLAAALLQYREGVHTPETLGWRLAVPTLGELGELLRMRYLEPLHRAGAFGDQVIEALRCYLSHGRSIPQSAAALHVHVNTLRYRLSRFEELTGRSLQDTDTIVELSCVLYGAPAS
ncbi:helix-turn-helix domain-containing protein [Kribbella sp. NBC_01484]|uniref:PucR family transcriptional regulator n=1 Tax=Kribbella sp. NBC_01484 TaxID=2903579 RepID=UPI002E3430D5|nr:helix-turn-helix domain-containing protein [Kribbella sp. NBC_01484]